MMIIRALLAADWPTVRSIYVEGMAISNCGPCKPVFSRKMQPVCASMRVLAFRLVGRRERIGQMQGAWRNTLVLERRSHIVGILSTTV